MALPFGLLMTTITRARAYVAATQARDSGRDISLGSGSLGSGALSDGTTLWFVDNTTSDTARAYVAATQARDSGKDISLGSGQLGLGGAFRRHDALVC